VAKWISVYANAPQGDHLVGKKSKLDPEPTVPMQKTEGSVADGLVSAKGSNE